MSTSSASAPVASAPVLDTAAASAAAPVVTDSPAAPEPAPDSVLASPHSHPVKTEGELRAAEVNCDGKVAGDCIRAADGYDRGIVPRDEERISRHRKVGRTLYLRQCDAGDPVACYQISRIYAEGDAVQKKPDAADAYRKRALDICQSRQFPACAELKQLVGP